MNPPVANPFALSISASVVCSGFRKKPPLSRTPCSGGKRPVNMLECAGRVSGALDIACAKRVPSPASRSRAGVFTSVDPYALRWSARSVSSVMTTMFRASRRTPEGSPPRSIWPAI